MVFYGTSSKVIRLSWVSQSIKAEKMEMGLKILSGRDGKIIDSTDNVKRGLKKLIESEKIEKGRHYFPNLPYEGGQQTLIYYLRGVNIFYLAFRGG